MKMHLLFVGPRDMMVDLLLVLRMPGLEGCGRCAFSAAVTMFSASCSQIYDAVS